MAILTALALAGLLGTAGYSAGKSIGDSLKRNDIRNFKTNFKDYIVDELTKRGTYTGSVKDFIDSADSDTLYSIAKTNGLVDEDSLVLDIYKGLPDVIDNIELLDSLYSEMPEVDWDSAVDTVLNGEDALTNAYLEELAQSEARQTTNFENQLKENQMAFDDYRSQVLGNQYQQNAQLMGSVDSAMSKARRNALEAGASAGLRMAENINTTLALQNKQAQTSLETSNQLAQQLLNQRQAAAGIRSDYNTMLDNNSAERRQYRESATQRVYNTQQEDLTNWENRFTNSTNPYAETYRESLRNKAQNKQSSQYSK